MDYREILSDCFQKKRNVNPRYSLRAFARDISMSPSRLSEVIAGKGQLSRAKGLIIAKKLKMPPHSAADFLDLIDAAAAPHPKQRAAALERFEKRKSTSTQRFLDQDSFKVIADPRYLAIWSFMLLPSYDGDPQTICKQFKLNSLELFDALKRLERLHLCQRDGDKWLGTKVQFKTDGSVPREVIQSYHRRMIGFGAKSIETQPLDRLHLDSAVMPFDSRRFQEIRQKIDHFTKELIHEFGDDQNGDCVYGLSLQFFRMTDPMI